MITVLLATLAAAQDAPQMNTQLYRLPIDSRTTLWTEDTTAQPDGYASGRAMMQYANSPFRYKTANGDIDRVVSDVAELDLAGGFTWSNLRFGAHIPLYMFTAGSVAPSAAGIGDIALDLKGTLLERADNPIGLALDGRVFLPTSSVETPLGAAGTGWEVAAIVDRRFGDVLVATNVGTRGVPDASFRDVTWNDQFFWRTGAGWSVTPDAGLSADLNAQTNWSSADNPAGTVLETMLGGWLPVSSDLVLRGGLSKGLTRSPGTANFRVLAGISFEPDPYPDTDLDGLTDRSDTCPLRAEDVDGYADSDGCPDPVVTTRLHFSDPNGTPVADAAVRLDGPEEHTLTGGDNTLDLHPGTYDLVVEARGYETIRTSVLIEDRKVFSVRQVLPPLEGTVRVWAVDSSGAAISDAAFTLSGGDPITADGTERITSIGEHSLVVTAPGYDVATVSLHVDRGERREYTAVLGTGGEGTASRVRVSSDRIQLAEKVFFELNKAQIKPASYGLLDEVATAMLTHPEITRVEIGGHTDTQGPKNFNERLSAARASAVREYLVSKGVSDSRMRSVGYGSSQPIDGSDTETAHERNRRVEFKIVDAG